MNTHSEITAEDFFVLFGIIAIVGFLIFGIVSCNIDDRDGQESARLEKEVSMILLQESTEGFERDDVWGSPVEYSYKETDTGYVASAKSCGKDKVYGTSDDIIHMTKKHKREKNIKRMADFLFK